MRTGLSRLKDLPNRVSRRGTELSTPMIPKTLFVRFYKSFNFDYLRKFHPEAREQAWERMDGLWYPHVRIALDPHITTMVGANESGKSHLLTAMEKAISGQGIERSDFCRYSSFLTAEAGKWRWPEFGIEWDRLSDREASAVCKACSTPEAPIRGFHMFRTKPDVVMVYLPERAEPFRVESDALQALQNALPRAFRIDPAVALPDRVPLAWLVSAGASASPGLSRAARMNLVQRAPDLLRRMTDPGAVQQQHAALSSEAKQLLEYKAGVKDEEDPRSMQLARDLLVKVGNVNEDVLADLHAAIRDGKAGHANGLIQRINGLLSSRLNFPSWWTQDKQFSLVVDAQESDLVFTIRDRTGTNYSFNERSSGLKYFLSYFVQSQAHIRPSDRGEILLMDEPDAYLSAQAQQDLLKILYSFAFPKDDSSHVPVVYVTHSPFLIDKNHAERIRVLEKGAGEEGTRVVTNASKNHYEPLRSALGVFVAETAFIGNCNLMVEGASDQVILAGAASVLRRMEHAQSETLDLNNITIVPCGSASHVPYMVYLARGRDQDRPAVIVLLDADDAGRRAADELQRGGPKRKQLLDSRYVRVLDSIPGLATSQRPTCLEDLIPVGIAVSAAASYLREFTGEEHADVDASGVTKRIGESCSLLQALEDAFSDAGKAGRVHIDKIGFARAVVRVLNERLTDHDDDHDVAQFTTTMKALFREINEMRRAALKDAGRASVGRRIEREKRRFVEDHPEAATREEAAQFLADLSQVLDETSESDDARVEINRLRRHFALDQDLHKPVDDYARFKAGLERVRYAHELAQLSDAQAGALAPAPDPASPQVARESGRRE